MVQLPRLADDTPPAWQNTSASEAKAPAPDLRGWWKAFNDPELDRLVDQALSGNLTIAQAALRIDAARTLADHRYAGFLPQFGVHTLNEPAPDSSASYFQMGFDTKWELGLFGRSTGHSRVVAGDLGIAESDRQAARVSVVAEVARSYVELRGAQRRQGLLEQLAADARDKVGLTETRVRLRLASANDLARARVEQASAEAALYEPRLAVVQSRQKLGVLLGKIEPDAALVGAGTQPELGDLRIASAPADLLRTRPEIRRAESEVLKAAGELGLARAELYPRLGLGGSLTYSARVIGRTRLSDADGIVTFGPAIDIPLFDWGARKAAADARDAELSASVLTYRQAVLEGIAEAETAMAALERQRERIAALGRGLAGVEHAAATTGTLRRLGLADGFDRVTSTAALVQARLEIAQAEQERNIAFIALYKALGGAPLPHAEPAD
ncbi:efflux transporter outer membrane subunit [Dokdonella soli]|uniref:Efflux transporter outer membrane subunit n=2 Tax=Dokdonella soli TaxID=529810 RepID=A0ABP3U7J1_9GAMM